ncbi:MAG: hypothetical protein AB1489_28660 [Acidobacteriota bacterium]
MSAEREMPGLCRQCQQWLCASKDLFCSCCGTALVTANISAERLDFTLRENDSVASLAIYNQGLFRLYWAAEVVSPEPVVRTLFSIQPDYGVLEPGMEQAVKVVLVSARTQRRSPTRAQLEIASNDPHRPLVKVAISIS